MLGFSLSGILYFIIGLIVVHAFVFSLIYVYLGKVAAAAKNNPTPPRIKRSTLVTTSPWIYRKDYAPHPFKILHAELTFDIGMQTTVNSRLQITHNTATAKSSTLRLDGETLELLDIALDGKTLLATDYQQHPHYLEIYHVPATFTLTTTVKISPDENKALEGLYRSGSMLCTQNEPEGFRKITYFIDRPDNLTRFKVRIEADKTQYPILLSNGNKLATGELGGDRHYAIWEDPYPKPSYLFALVAGDFDIVEGYHTTAYTQRKVLLQILVDRGYASQADFALESLRRAMIWDEQRFGLEYDLDIYMIVAAQAFNMGAMENKGLNLFNAKYVLADTASATDHDYLQIEAVIGHEYFHNWTGNRVTCRDWFQLTLKEGLTVFRDEEFTSDLHSPAVKRIQDVRYLREHQFSEDASPLAHPIQPDSYKEINNFYTATVYNKGAEVIRMLHSFLGETAFQKGIAHYLKTHDGSAATTQNFIDAFRPYTTLNLDHFSAWYHQSGTPVCEIHDHYDPNTQTYTLTVQQQQTHDDTPPLLMPLRLGLLGKTGEKLTFVYDGQSQEEVLLVYSQLKQTFILTAVSEKPIPSLFRGFSAPIETRYAYTDDELAILMGHDVDTFNRFEATEKLMIAAVREQLADTQNLPSRAFLEGFARILESGLENPTYVAETLKFPSVSRIADALGRTDFSKIAAARKSVMTQIAQVHAPLLRRFGEPDIPNPTWNAIQVGQRQLRLVCLAYLRLAGCEYLDLIYQIFLRSTTMTEKIGTLALLCHQPSSETSAALAKFESTWTENPLVMQKWLSVQANAEHDQVIDHVKSLRDHPIMDIANPNFIRSLIGVFAYNLPYFHHDSGSGYRLLADTLAQLDPINPQTASRLAKRFQILPKLSTEHQAMAKDALRQALGGKVLSRDTEEVLSTLDIFK